MAGFLAVLITKISSYFNKKTITGEDFEEIHLFFLGRICYNLDFRVQYGNDGDMITTDPTKLVYYVVKCVSEAYTLQEVTTCYG